MSINATGGAETTIAVDGVTYRIHTFTASGNFTVTAGGPVEYLIVAGGGSGGRSQSGGGGAGGLLSGSIDITPESYTIIVGAGGEGQGGIESKGISGAASSAFGISAVGGGGGGAYGSGSGLAGGSGGGGGSALGGGASGSGTAGPPRQGNDGGSVGTYNIPYRGGGGGGAGTAGATGETSGNGGAGLQSSITGASVFYAGGGGGGAYNSVAGLGGAGGGGFGVNDSSTPGNGTDNTGGGGGGTGYPGFTSGAGGSGIVIVRYQIPTPPPPQGFLYAFTTATFTPGGATGRDGPTLTQSRTGLTGPESDNWKTNTAFFGTADGIQLWTVPKTGFYRIQTSGAQGGTSSGQAGGRGTQLAGDFQLTQGEIIRILVGQQGQTGGHSQNSSQFVSAGGGGTFVVRSPYNTLQSVLVIAGGGGGAANNTWTVAAGRPALLTESGNSGQGGVAGGTAGGGGGGGDGSGSGPGGAGFSGNGLVDPLSGNPAGDNARSFVNGGRGGRNSRSWSGPEIFGGFGGGGGGGGLAAGGGGGYSGGGGGTWSASQAGGGGGSFNAGTEQINTADINTEHGFVIITYLFTPDGLSVNSNSLVNGETLTVTLTSQDTAAGTAVPYTISGVDSADINNAPIIGNFTIVDGVDEVSFLITTTSKKTLSITSNGFTQTVSLTENIYGLSLLSEDPNILFSSVNFPLSVDLSSNANLTSIAILSAQDLYKFYPQASDSVTVLTSLNSPTVIDLSTTASTASLLNITILQTTDLYQHAVQLGDPVLVSDKVYYSTDFVSITNFNVPEPIPLTFLERWAG